jgi:ethanolamine-phosphate cytidylyltransferase
MEVLNSTAELTDDFSPTLFTRYTGLNISLIASIVISSDNILEECSNSLPISVAVTNINAFLAHAGVPKKSLLTSDEFVLACFSFIITLVMYYILMGKGHSKKRRRLAADLKIAQDKVHFLEEKLMLFEDDGHIHEGGEIRIFMDGAFDMMHYGHMNAFRLARSLGTHLVVGVNSDKSITECKGSPLMGDDERLTMVKGCKFVDEVVPDCPYVMSEKYLEWVIKTHKIDYVIHGDDPCIVNGKDVYESAKKAGKFQSIPRTEGKKQ